MMLHTANPGLGSFLEHNGIPVSGWCLFAPWMESCNPVAPLPTPANVQTPVAPQTINQLTNPTAWTPDEAAAWSNYVAAQAQQAVTDDRTFWQTASTGQTPAGAVGQPQTPGSSNTVLWVVGGIAATLFLLTAMKR